MVKVSPRSILVRQAHSVRYIADHCPFLTQFRIQPYLQGSVTWSSRKRRGLRNVAPKSTEALIQAIVYLSETCEHLETIYIRAIVEVHRTEDCYLNQKQCRLNTRFGSCMCRDQDYGYLLEEMSWLERLDGVEMWVRCFLDRCGCTSLFGSWRSDLAVFEIGVISVKSVGGPKSCYEGTDVLHSATDRYM